MALTSLQQERLEKHTLLLLRHFATFAQRRVHVVTVVGRFRRYRNCTATVVRLPVQVASPENDLVRRAEHGIAEAVAFHDLFLAVAADHIAETVESATSHHILLAEPLDAKALYSVFDVEE